MNMKGSTMGGIPVTASRPVGTNFRGGTMGDTPGTQIIELTLLEGEEPTPACSSAKFPARKEAARALLEVKAGANVLLA